MHTPHHYLLHATGRQDASLDAPDPHTHVSWQHAQAAVAQAQADLHAYYRQLMRAVRNSRPTLSTTQTPEPGI